MPKLYFGQKPEIDEAMRIATIVKSTLIAGGMAIHDLVGGFHSATGLTLGQPLRATGATTFAFGPLDLANDDATTGILPPDHIGAHNILSATHGDSTAAAVVRGDVITGQGSTPKWVRLAISVPAAGLMNYLGAANGDTEPGYKALFDATVPTTIAESAAAATGTATVAARRDHTHGAPATWAATAHNVLSATHGDSTTAAAVRGDIITAQGEPPGSKWTRLAISVPAAGLMNYLGTANGDTEPAYKALFDAVVPTTIAESAAAAAGTATVAARRDHTHGAPATYAATAHNVLSATHGDSTAAAVVRGDIITGQGATPKWVRLAKGTANAVLTGNGTDVAWSTYFISGTAGGTTALAVTNAKTLTLTAVDDYNLTIPATGTAALLQSANVFTNNQKVSTTGAATSWFSIDPTASQQGVLYFHDGGTAKWSWFKHTDNTFNLYNYATSHTILKVTAADAVSLPQLTASTLCYLGASSVLTSLANATGYLYNSGAGVLSWKPSTAASVWLTPAQITASQNNYSPGTAEGFRLSADADWNITGWAAGTDGQFLYVINVGTAGNTLTFMHESGSSTAANRFDIVGDVNAVVDGGGNSIFFVYDGGTSRWRQFGYYG